jgi:hypothetical protein
MTRPASGHRSAADEVSTKGNAQRAAPIQRRHELKATENEAKTPPGIVLENTFGPTLSKRGLNYGFRIGNDELPKFASQETGNVLYRPNSAEALIDKLKGGESRAKIIAKYGYVGAQERAIFGRKRVQTYDGGHLIGHQFFGSDADIDGNLAPQHNKFNQLSWRLFEEILEKGFFDPSAKYGPKSFGEEVKVKVTLRYSSDTYQRSLKDLHEAGVIDEDQYNCLKKDGGMKDGQMFTFDTFVPLDWEGHAQSTNPKAKSTQITRAPEGGFAYNIQEDKSQIEKVVPKDDSDDEFYPASQETHGTLGGLELDTTANTLTYGGNNQETFFGKQSIPRPPDKQKEAAIGDYYYLNKSSGGKTKTAIIKVIVPNLAKPVSMAHLKTLDLKKSPTTLAKEDDQFAELCDKIGQKTVCKQLVFRLKNYDAPSGKSEIKDFLTKVAIKSVISPGHAKTKFLSLWLDPNFVD